MDGRQANPDGDTLRICNPIKMIEWITNPFLFAFGLAGAQAFLQIRKRRSTSNIKL